MYIKYPSYIFEDGSNACVSRFCLDSFFPTFWFNNKIFAFPLLKKHSRNPLYMRKYNRILIT